jgi:2-aminoadipate transaminase
MVPLQPGSRDNECLPMTPARQFSQRVQFGGAQPIGELMQLALHRPELISLAAGFVDQASLPVEETRRATETLLADVARGRAALQYGTNAGLLALREQVLARFLAAEGPQPAPPTIDQVLLTAGSNQLLHLAGEVLFDPGDIVLCSAPTYFVYLGLLASFGARAVGVAIDEEGMIPAALDEELDRRRRAGELSRVKAIYVTSYFENPSTVTLARDRRPQLVEIARRWSKDHTIYVIDDTAYRELRYAGDDLPSLRSFDPTGETVIVADTFSKSYSPGVRVGWGILPPALVEPVSRLKINIDFGSPSFNQYLMATVLELGLFEPHVRALRARYREKLAAMLAAMDEHMSGIPGAAWHRPTGGLYVWLQLPEGMDAGPGGRLMDNALEDGVLYVPGQYGYPPEGEPARHDRIRLSFGVQTTERIGQGIETLARAIRRSR